MVRRVAAASCQPGNRNCRQRPGPGHEPDTVARFCTLEPSSAHVQSDELDVPLKVGSQQPVLAANYLDDRFNSLDVVGVFRGGLVSSESFEKRLATVSARASLDVGSNRFEFGNGCSAFEVS